MANWTHFYLIRIEFLGFRYHGWQKQSNYKSVHGMIDKTFDFIFSHSNYRSLGCSRTDAKVSANDYAFELFTNEKLEMDGLLVQLNENLPADIRAKSVHEVDSNFNIIQDVRAKEYHYYFSFGEKSHPYNAPFIRDCGKYLNIQLMKEAAELFVGVHNFRRYATKPSVNTVFERDVEEASVSLCENFQGQFSPDNVYVFKVKSKGFLRYQVRLMMGMLIEIGKEKLSLDDLRETLTNYDGPVIRNIAASSGLVLHNVMFEYTSC